jgi:hypothetical protein
MSEMSSEKNVSGVILVYRSPTGRTTLETRTLARIMAAAEGTTRGQAVEDTIDRKAREKHRLIKGLDKTGARGNNLGD